MNFCFLAAGIWSLFSAFAHIFKGTPESLTTDPRLLPHTKGVKPTILKNWIQLMGCFHMVSVDLLFFGIIQILLGLGLFFTAPTEIAGMIGIFFLWYGIAWRTTLYKVNTPETSHKDLPQWILSFVNAGLMFSGIYLCS